MRDRKDKGENEEKGEKERVCSVGDVRDMYKETSITSNKDAVM